MISDRSHYTPGLILSINWQFCLDCVAIDSANAAERQERD